MRGELLQRKRLSPAAWAIVICDGCTNVILQQGHRGLVHKGVIPRTELSGAVQSYQPLYPDFGPILVEEKLALESFKIYLLALTQGCIATDQPSKALAYSWPLLRE